MNKERIDLLKKLIKSFQQSHMSITRIKAKTNDELPHGQKALLLTVAMNAGSSVKQLSNVLGITSAAVTQQLEVLVTQNILIREQDPSDRRNVIVSLSESGKELVSQLQEARIEKIGKYFSDITDEQLTNFVEVLDKVNLTIEKELNI